MPTDELLIGWQLPESPPIGAPSPAEAPAPVVRDLDLDIVRQTRQSGTAALAAGLRSAT